MNQNLQKKRGTQCVYEGGAVIERGTIAE